MVFQGLIDQRESTYTWLEQPPPFLVSRGARYSVKTLKSCACPNPVKDPRIDVLPARNGALCCLPNEGARQDVPHQAPAVSRHARGKGRNGAAHYSVSPAASARGLARVMHVTIAMCPALQMR